jgi:hypothetical protein
MPLVLKHSGGIRAAKEMKKKGLEGQENDGGGLNLCNDCVRPLHAAETVAGTQQVM